MGGGGGDTARSHAESTTTNNLVRGISEETQKMFIIVFGVVCAIGVVAFIWVAGRLASHGKGDH